MVLLPAGIWLGLVSISLLAPALARECKTNEQGWGYSGHKDRTQSGLLCQRWDLQSPHDHRFTTTMMYPDNTLADAGNYCRNPEGIEDLWCFTIDPNTRWEFCHVPMCPEQTQHEARKCKMDKKGLGYIGHLNRTISGLSCQRWDSSSPHSHGWKNPRWFPDVTIADAANYCRNPADEDGHLWCYTMDPGTRWELCSVPMCSTPAPPGCGPYARSSRYGDQCKVVTMFVKIYP